MRYLNGFSHDLEPELLANGRHTFPAFLAEPLERVRRRSWSPKASTKEPSTTLLHCVRERKHLHATLDRAWPSNDFHLAVANRRVANANHSFLRSQVECDQFVRLCNENDFRNTGHVFETP